MSVAEHIAVVGMAGVLPGAHRLDRFWSNLVHKHEAIGQVPPARWIAPAAAMTGASLRPDAAVSGRAGLIHDFVFEPGGFQIPAELLAALDPVYHLVLVAGRAALRDVVSPTVDAARIGTILAAIALPTDAASTLSRDILGSVFEQKLFGANATSAFALRPFQAWSAQVTSLPAALLARALDLGGGSYTLDAACASSLYAVYLACLELQAGRADMMLAGGVSRPDCLYTQVGFSQLRALSPTGRCAPFDRRADGLVVGEGVGMFVLKRLRDACQAGDKIYGVIRGIGLSNDVGGTLLAPVREGQVRAMRSAYAMAAWLPQEVDLIECHGAGTPLGDLTELESLCTLWGEDGWIPGQCAIGSVKSMIGHLLTAAGAAGLIKVLLGLKHRLLPPTLHFESPPPHSPLPQSPFRVQTETEPWPQRHADRPRRAAVSAFGFGGINAHLLVEEWCPDMPTQPVSGSLSAVSLPQGKASTAPATTRSTSQPAPVAVVGLETILGKLADLEQFRQAIFNGQARFENCPSGRWRGGRTHVRGGKALFGKYIDQLAIDPSVYRIPPSELEQILPQQLLMLQAAAGALNDADISLERPHANMGALIGIEFDYEATNFHLRWHLLKAIGQWQQRYGLPINDRLAQAWLPGLQEAFEAPLNATRTIGALGSIVASRIAKTFSFGGPSFAVSCEAASGLRALEIGVRLIQTGQVERMLVGAVDMTGDIRRTVVNDAIAPFSQKTAIYPFDQRADGTLPGEGAAALVLKRLDQAQQEGDRIYAVICGVHAAGGGNMDRPLPPAEAYARSLRGALAEAGFGFDAVGLYEAHGSGIPAEDQLEWSVLADLDAQTKHNGALHCAVGSAPSICGHTGAVAGLVSLIKASLALYHQMIPPLSGFKSPPAACVWDKARFYLPRKSHYWYHNRGDGERKALVASLSGSGHCMHVALEEAWRQQQAHTSTAMASSEPQRLVLPLPHGLFVVSGDSREELQTGLDKLAACLAGSTASKEGQIPPGLQTTGTIDGAARRWFQEHPPANHHKLALAMVVSDAAKVPAQIQAARTALAATATVDDVNTPNVFFTSRPLGPSGQLAFVYPGSGNHFTGMTRQLGLYWPALLRALDRRTDRLKDQMRPAFYMPFRSSWPEHWRHSTLKALETDLLNMIFGQVMYGTLTSELAQRCGLRAQAVIGYSLGESTGLFATGAWPEREVMFERMQATDLFHRKLAGPCLAVREAWRIEADQDFRWRVAVVNCPAGRVRPLLKKWPHTRLLIVNTATECVIGGHATQVEQLIQALKCDAFDVKGVATVHCDALRPVREAYRALHHLPTRPVGEIGYYSCAWGKSYKPTSNSAADAVTAQALHGFDFTRTICQAHADGVRVFLEMGPRASCTRMIQRILSDRPHLALSLSHSGTPETLTVMQALARLVVHRVPVDLDFLYGRSDRDAHKESTPHPVRAGEVVLTIAKGPIKPPPPPEIKAPPSRQPQPIATTVPSASNQGIGQDASDEYGQQPMVLADLFDHFNQSVRLTSHSHQHYLRFAASLTQAHAEGQVLYQRLLSEAIRSGRLTSTMIADAAAFSAQPINAAEAKKQRTLATPISNDTGRVAAASSTEVAYTREMCMEFAIGSVGKVLGPQFEAVDAYRARVRLPDEPLMLVDRILSVTGTKGALGPGRIVTEHDVLPGAWYLDGGRAPVCISVEAGQADLFLSAYLGIDLVVKGERTYRLLDATVIFHRGLPRPGDVIRYTIDIQKFIRQGDTYMFFFNFEGFIGQNHLITMHSGCAGFFTPEEVDNSGGIVMTEEERRAVRGQRPKAWRPLAAMQVESYSDEALEALREGRLAQCFGAQFEGLTLAPSLRLPGKGGHRMRLIDRVLRLDPEGGRHGLGLIRAEADIRPEAWFLTCHFMDDMVMPGTLMYECCAHTLRVFLQRMGWISSRSDVCYEPVIGVASRLKCRGPVTPQTCHVVYEIELSKIGYDPEPYAIADANMYADGHHIVMFKNMSMKMTGATRQEMEALWHSPRRPKTTSPAGRPLFDRAGLIEFAQGKPSVAFGEPYRAFDTQRFIARLPRPPYLFMDAVTHCEPSPWVLKPGGWITAEYTVRKDDWYFKANRTPSVPFSVLLEIALQPCGWLAAYMGSALKSQKDLHFRNLGGQAVQHQELHPASGQLTIRTRLTQASEAADMIIEHFEFKVLKGHRPVYTGSTYFGFFTRAALAQQIGLRDPERHLYVPSPHERQTGRSIPLPDLPPLTPEDGSKVEGPALALPAMALRMIDGIDLYCPEGGTHGLGFVRGVKRVVPQEWFFRAHFYQDPVCPGSLGLESFLQLLKAVALERWPTLAASHRFSPLLGVAHKWTYRGQIRPTNQQVTVEASISTVQDKPHPLLRAEGVLKVDDLPIYVVKDMGLTLVPLEGRTA